MNRDFLYLHLAILVAGFTGILGRLISLPEGPLVLYRMFLSTVMLAGYFQLKGKLPRISMREMLKISGVGALVAVHWIFFYGSIKYANVSIAVACFAMIGFFTAIVEPVVSRSKISVRELVFSLITVAGIVLIFHFDTRYRLGIVLGVLGAFFGALFTITMKRVSKKHDSGTMLLFQMSGGFLFLALLAPVYLWFLPKAALVPSAPDVFYLLVLSSVCTIGLFLLEIAALRTISAFTANLSFNLEPVYSIVLAMIIFDEARELNAAFFAGLGLICVSVALQSMYALRQRGGVR